MREEMREKAQKRKEEKGRYGCQCPTGWPQLLTSGHTTPIQQSSACTSAHIVWMCCAPLQAGTVTLHTRACRWHRCREEPTHTHIQQSQIPTVRRYMSFTCRIHTSTQLHLYACIYTHTHTYIHTYIHKYIHTYKHTYIHTYVCT